MKKKSIWVTFKDDNKRKITPEKFNENVNGLIRLLNNRSKKSKKLD